MSWQKYVLLGWAVLGFINLSAKNPHAGKQGKAVEAASYAVTVSAVSAAFVVLVVTA